MPDDNRKPFVIALLVGIAVVAVFVLSSGFGGGGRPADASWRDALSRFDTSEPLLASDLVEVDRGGDGGCTVTNEAIVVASRCSFDIDPFGGTFGLGPTTKKASITFVTTAAVLTVRMDIEGASVSQGVERNKALDLSVGQSGGTVDFVCVGLNPCVMELKS